MTAGTSGESGKTRVATFYPDGTLCRHLGALGHVTPPVYSFTLPGGCNQLTCTLEREPTFRHEAMNVGRLVRAYRGGSVVWNGRMLEPVYSTNGWQLSAVGSGNFGAFFDAIYTTWSNQNDAVNQAIARGLNWVNPGIPAGVFFGQQVDSGAQTIDALLNLFCTKGGYTWYVGRGNVLSVYLWSTTPVTRILTSTVPAPRTLGGDYNAIYARYQTTASKAGATAAYAVTSVTTAQSITQHGRMELYEDLSNAGPMSAGAAQALIQNKLNLYQRASFSGPFTVRQGELLTAGGTPVDLGCEQAGTVVRLVLQDYGYGGEIVPGPVSFVVGTYEYDDSKGTAQITPFQALDLSLSGLLGTIDPTKKTKKKK